MSEYIITDEGMGFDMEDALAEGGYIKERVVRCRDCRAYGREWCKRYCKPCEPTDFCAWGVRA